MNTKKLVLLEINEINFDLISHYVEKYPRKFKNFAKLFSHGVIKTNSEKRYEELEPWIQWVSAHTGKDFQAHQIFRLGDIVGNPINQIFECIEKDGYRVGAISPMNAENRLCRPAYFIPDPWTNTTVSGPFLLRLLSRAISAVVNGNATSKMGFLNSFILMLGLFSLLNHRNFILFAILLIKSTRKRWFKAIFLDYLLHQLHLKLFSKTNVDFSTVFLNAGAHIQHHYFFNSEFYSGPIRNPSWYILNEEDPLRDVYAFYDILLADYLNLKNCELILATGLSQIAYDKKKYYYRLRDHQSFLSKLNIKFIKVEPRMTRDFTIFFETVDDAIHAEKILSYVKITGSNDRFFNEIDNRGLSLFVTLTYPNEVTKSDELVSQNFQFPIYDYVAFVAIKNGMHCPIGYVYLSRGLKHISLENFAHISGIYAVIKKFFSGA